MWGYPNFVTPGRFCQSSENWKASTLLVMFCDRSLIKITLYSQNVNVTVAWTKTFLSWSNHNQAVKCVKITACCMDVNIHGKCHPGNQVWHLTGQAGPMGNIEVGMLHALMQQPSCEPSLSATLTPSVTVMLVIIQHFRLALESGGNLYMSAYDISAVNPIKIS